MDCLLGRRCRWSGPGLSLPFLDRRTAKPSIQTLGDIWATSGDRGDHGRRLGTMGDVWGPVWGPWGPYGNGDVQSPVICACWGAIATYSIQAAIVATVLSKIQAISWVAYTTKMPRRPAGPIGFTCQCHRRLAYPVRTL